MLLLTLLNIQLQRKAIDLITNKLADNANVFHVKVLKRHMSKRSFLNMCTIYSIYTIHAVDTIYLRLLILVPVRQYMANSR